IKKTQKKFFENQQSHQQNQPKKEDGKTTVDYVPNDHKKKNNDLGEYIDFEEIDDKDNNK
ncbi:MAG: hypothetical protein U9R32_03715, partial [Bacteroidota bacterium]|nr:hypothetical protein [Bacteroidota bacterium]